MAEQRRLYEDSMSQLWANLGTSELSPFISRRSCLFLAK